MTEIQAKQDTLYVASLAKGLQVLRAFDETAPEMSLGQIDERTGLGKSAVQRLVNTLVVEGFLDKDPRTRRVRPSVKYLEMAYAYMWTNGTAQLAMPKLVDLSRRLGETINMAQVFGTDIVYVIRIPNQRSQFAASLVGRRAPALNTASGRAMLALLPPEARAQAIGSLPLKGYTPRTVLDREAIAASVEECVELGYCLTRDQLILNEVSVAAPIRDAEGRPGGAVQCAGSGFRWDEARLRDEIIPAVVDVANGITAARACDFAF